MIYDTIISTGTTTISGCSSAELGTDTYSSLNNDALGSTDVFTYNRSISSGQREIQLGVNAQTLLQEIPITGQATNEIIYQIKTGDFFTKTAKANILERSQLYFDNSTPAAPNSNIFYNIITGGIFVGTGDLGLSLKSGISGQYENSSFADYDYFLNGQKVYSGVGVGVSTATEGIYFIPQFGVGATYGGVVTADNKDKFKYTAYRKPVRTHSITGSGPDVFSATGFIENRNIYYINGLQELQNAYLELYTGVSMVKRGFRAVISGDFEGSQAETNILL